MKSKDVIVRVGATLGLIFAMYLIITKLISPAIMKSGDDFKSMFVVISLIITIYLVNAIGFAFNLEELRKILMGEGNMFLALLLPFKADIVLRDYYAEFQSEVGEEEGLGSIYAVLPILSSLLLVIVSVTWLPYTLYREGILFMSRELGLVAIVVFVLFTITQIFRNIAVTKIVKACGSLTYINNPSKYLMIALAISAGWALVFIVSPMLALVGINITYPIINIFALVLPLTVLPISTYLGIKATRKDMTLDYDMDI